VAVRFPSFVAAISARVTGWHVVDRTPWRRHFAAPDVIGRRSQTILMGGFLRLNPERFSEQGVRFIESADVRKLVATLPKRPAEVTARRRGLKGSIAPRAGPGRGFALTVMVLSDASGGMATGT
jgi:hypothetical protein